MYNISSFWLIRNATLKQRVKLRYLCIWKCDPYLRSCIFWFWLVTCFSVRRCVALISLGVCYARRCQARVRNYVCKTCARMRKGCGVKSYAGCRCTEDLVDAPRKTQSAHPKMMRLFQWTPSLQRIIKGAASKSVYIPKKSPLIKQKD